MEAQSRVLVPEALVPEALVPEAMTPSRYRRRPDLGQSSLSATAFGVTFIFGS